MVDDVVLLRLMRAIAAGDRLAIRRELRAVPALASATLAVGGTRATAGDYFLAECAWQLYVGDTALHVAAAAYDFETARRLVAAGANVRAKNRRKAEPLHAAMQGNPAAGPWDPPRQVAVITYLLDAGADPNATAAGGVTPLHRAVRNRCSAAVAALLAGGADRTRPNDSGSTALDLAGWTTGRGGTGSAEAKAEQSRIVDLLS